MDMTNHLIYHGAWDVVVGVLALFKHGLTAITVQGGELLLLMITEVFVYVLFILFRKK